MLINGGRPGCWQKKRVTGGEGGERERERKNVHVTSLALIDISLAASLLTTRDGVESWCVCVWGVGGGAAADSIFYAVNNSHGPPACLSARPARYSHHGLISPSTALLERTPDPTTTYRHTHVRTFFSLHAQLKGSRGLARMYIIGTLLSYQIHISAGFSQGGGEQ